MPKKAKKKTSVKSKEKPLKVNISFDELLKIAAHPEKEDPKQEESDGK